jgi:glutamate formiminotransferase/formiminotetrahydrofolate cyclodeaminase
LKLVECVPNFSEGRRKEVIQEIVSAIKSVPGVTVLDVESNADHNRSVISFVGEATAVKEAALAGAGKAVQLIDLNTHKGEHPRMGAVDVVPFVPLSGANMEDCVRLARDFGREFSDRFQVPVFLYEEAATVPERRNLADVRAGEFEGLKDRMGKDPSKKPDFGPEKVHPTAGATAVGAREILVAYNVNLGTGDVAIAKKIAHEVRAKDGGLSYVKALGFELKDRGIVQVSMNLTNFHKTQLFKAYELIGRFAQRYSVPIIGSEVVGLIPMDALVDSAEFYHKLENFSREQILEKRLFTPVTSRTLTDESLSAFCEDVSSRKAVPGGGSVSAYMGALAAGLVCMVARITLGRKDQPKDPGLLNRTIAAGEDLRERLLKLVVEDAEAFSNVLKALKIPKEQLETRKAAIQESTRKAAEVPLSTMENSVHVLRLARDVAEHGAVNALSDATTAAAAGKAAVEGAASNVLINLEILDDRNYSEKVGNSVTGLRKEAVELEEQVRELVATRSRRK